MTLRTEYRSTQFLYRTHSLLNDTRSFYECGFNFKQAMQFATITRLDNANDDTGYKFERISCFF